jgi:hypothetical protein
VTGVNYEQGPGKVTTVGEKSLASRGAQLKNDYSTQFLPGAYDPDSVFVRCINDQQSIIGSYAYLMGAYPHSLNGITLEPDIEPIYTVPVTNYDVNQVRGNIRLPSADAGAKKAKIHPGNPDALFLTKIGDLYPGLVKRIDEQVYDAQVEYERAYGTGFYSEFADAIHKAPTNVNFHSVYRYADDILTTKANGKASAVELSKDLKDKLNVYYSHYFGRGIFRDKAVTRVFAHPYLSSVAHELSLKVEDDQSGTLGGQGVHNLKHSVYLGNHLTLLAALNLFDEVEDYQVDFNDELRFQLFKKDGQYFVRTLLNDRPLSLEGINNAEGETSWERWREYICTKLYYGNPAKVRRGEENPDEHTALRGTCTSFLANSFYSNDKVLMKDNPRPPPAPESPTPVPSIMIR